MNWLKGGPDAIEKVRALLDHVPLEDELIAQATSLKLDDIERLDHMIMTKEGRRDNAWRAIERRRASLGAQCRRVAEEIEDAEFSVIEKEPAKQQHIAL